MRQQALSQCRPRSLSLYVVAESQWVKPCHIELCCTWILDHPVQQGYIYLEAVHVVVHLSKAPPWSLLEVHRSWYIDCGRHSLYALVHTQRKSYGDSLWWRHDMEMFFILLTFCGRNPLSHGFSHKEPLCLGIHGWRWKPPTCGTVT